MSLETASWYASVSSLTSGRTGSDELPAVPHPPPEDLGQVQLLAGLVHGEEGVVDGVERSLEIAGECPQLRQRHQGGPEKGVVADPAEGVDGGGDVTGSAGDSRSGPIWYIEPIISQ